MKNIKRIYLLLLVIVTGVIISGCGGSASSEATGEEEIPQAENAPDPLENPVDIKIGYPTQGVSMLPLWIAEDKGIFEKYGINAELLYISGTPKVQETLNGGGIDVGLTGVDSVAKAKEVGVDSIILAPLADRMATYVYAAEGTDKEDLKNELKDKTLITASEGSIYDHLAKYFVEENGLKPNEDVNMLYMGGEGDRTAAFMKGDGEYYVVSPPTSFKMDDLEFPRVYDFTDLEVLVTGVVMKEDYYEENPDLAEVLIASLIEANAYIVNNKEQSIETITKWTGIDDPEIAEKTYDVNLDTIPKKPYVSNESVEFLLNSSDEEAVRNMNPSDIIDFSLVEELDESGFIDSLYENN